MKPAYAIPSMAEIRAVPDAGLTVVSTFSGTGGSCLGFRWAGYRTLWASEFVPAARWAYRANFPDVPLDDRDIRAVQPGDILDAIGLDVGELDVLEGSPPCASFSTSGKGAAHWGEERRYSDVTQRVDDLFDEYVRILRGLRPRVFVAENVYGLVRGVAKGFFKRIHASLAASGYRVEVKLLDAQWLGVPQVRRRIIFQGVREDIGLDPAWPTPLPYRYSVRDAIPWIASARWRSRIAIGSGEQTAPIDEPVPTIMTMGRGQFAYPQGIVEGDLTSLDGYAIGEEWDKLKLGEVSGRYQNLVRSDPDTPAPTVTQTAGNVGAAGITHPYERRKFTIAELRRLCGFPDDFVLPGTFTQQWERLGRAVPPPMMFAVARAIREGVLT